MSSTVSLAFDFLDPWGWIAGRRLRLAMHAAGVTRPVQYLPCRAAGSRAAVGQVFADYQLRRFGSQAALQEKRLIAEASRLDLPLHRLNIDTIPDAWLAMLAMTSEQAYAPQLFEAVYTAIYQHGRDVGDPAVMAELLRGQPHGQTVQQLAENRVLSDEVLQNEQAVRRWSHGLTPCIRIGDTVISGAQPPSILARLLAELASADATPDPLAACLSTHDEHCAVRNRL